MKDFVLCMLWIQASGIILVLWIFVDITLIKAIVASSVDSEETTSGGTGKDISDILDSLQFNFVST